MATKNSSTTKSTSSSNKKRTVWGINKISFYAIVAVAVLYVVSMILACVGLNLKIVNILQNVATAIMVIIVAVLAWRYVKPKQTVWKVLYVLCLLLVLVGVVIPLVV
jgi:hypothetical protein